MKTNVSRLFAVTLLTPKRIVRSSLPWRDRHGAFPKRGCVGVAASPASGHQGQIFPQLTGSTCPGPASESCSCNSAKSHGDQRLRPGC